MTTNTLIPDHRILIAVIGMALGATALPVSAMDSSRIDHVPGHVSEMKFESMSEAEIYELDIAQKRGRRVLIGDHTPSESQRMVDEALQSHMVTGDATH